MQKTSPALILVECIRVANDDKSVLGPRDADIDPVILLDERAWSCPDHRYKDEVKFAPLRAINREDLVVDLILDEALSYRILLRVVGCNHVDRVLGELLDRDSLIFLVNFQRVLEDFKTVSEELVYHFNFLIVVERGPFEPLAAIRHVDEKEWGV